MIDKYLLEFTNHFLVLKDCRSHINFVT